MIGGIGFEPFVVQAADVRIKFINEVLSGIRIIKFYAWEEAFKKMIGKAREKELAMIRQHALWMFMGMLQLVFIGCNLFPLFSFHRPLLRPGLQGVFMQMPVLLQVTVFVTYYLLGGESPSLGCAMCQPIS